MPLPALRVRRFRLLTHPVKTRFPFRYGIACLVEMPHLFISLDVEVDGRLVGGTSAENLPPKWFTKNPDSRFEDDCADMVSVIRHACETAMAVGTQPSFFALWRRLHDEQAAWGEAQGHPPLLCGLGISLVERALLDALCRALHTPAHRLLRGNAIGLDLGEVRPELAGCRLGDVLARQPLSSVALRHTVGLADPLDDDDVVEPLNDGLPHTLRQNIRAYGLRWFKIKLSGNPDADYTRLRRLADILPAETKGDFHFTVDGNENYPDIGSFRASWERITSEHVLAAFLRNGLIFVEQPLHRARSLDEEVQSALDDWPAAPPLIIDEADADLDALPRALGLGYSGTSHKNCKGIVKGLANAALIARRRSVFPGRNLILSGEDLSTLGPVGLLQDLAIMAALGIPHVERNAHHYFRGLTPFPTGVQEQMRRDHADLYHRHPEGFAALRVEGGRIAFDSANGPGFGPRHPVDLGFAHEIASGS